MSIYQAGFHSESLILSSSENQTGKFFQGRGAVVHLWAQCGELSQPSSSSEVHSGDTYR